MNETESMNSSMPKEILDPDLSTLIDLNKLTGELTFKRRIDYEELVNKVMIIVVECNIIASR